jgi:hypothetical protein
MLYVKLADRMKITYVNELQMGIMDRDGHRKNRILLALILTLRIRPLSIPGYRPRGPDDDGGSTTANRS